MIGGGGWLFHKFHEEYLITRNSSSPTSRGAQSDGGGGLEAPGRPVQCHLAHTGVCLTIYLRLWRVNEWEEVGVPEQAGLHFDRLGVLVED